jgi:hypothetical protein
MIRDFSSCLEKKSTDVEAAFFGFLVFLWLCHYQMPKSSPQPPQPHLNNFRALHPSKNPKSNIPIYFASDVYFIVFQLFLFNPFYFLRTRTVRIHTHFSFGEFIPWRIHTPFSTLKTTVFGN